MTDADLYQGMKLGDFQYGKAIFAHASDPVLHHVGQLRLQAEQVHPLDDLRLQSIRTV